MKKITKEMCDVYVKDSYKSKFICLVAVCIFVIVVLWFFTKNAIVVAISIALAIIAITLVFVAASKKIKNINPGVYTPGFIFFIFLLAATNTSVMAIIAKAIEIATTIAFLVKNHNTTITKIQTATRHMNFDL